MTAAAHPQSHARPDTKPATALGRKITEEPTGIDYLKMLAVSRLFLDNIQHIQASWLTQGIKLGQTALRFGADDMQLRFNGEPFTATDFAQLYSALLHRGEGRDGQARNVLSLGLCAALQLDPALIHVESGESFVELRPGQPDRLGTLPAPAPLTQIRVRHRLGLDLLKRYVDHLGGHLTEELLLQERCHHACMAIELDGRIISQGHTFPSVALARTFSSDGITGTVAIAPLPAAAPADSSVQMAPAAVLSPSFLRLIKNDVWVDTQLPIELLPGFLALAASSAYRLDFSREHVVQDSQYAAALRAVAAAQVELLATLCERSAQGPFMDVLHLRSLLRGLLARLTREHEAAEPKPWKMGDSAPEFIDEMLSKVVVDFVRNGGAIPAPAKLP